MTREELEARFTALESKVYALEMDLETVTDSLGITSEEEDICGPQASIDDLMEESKTLLDAGTPLKVFNTEAS